MYIQICICYTYVIENIIQICINPVSTVFFVSFWFVPAVLCKSCPSPGPAFLGYQSELSICRYQQIDCQRSQTETFGID